MSEFGQIIEDKCLNFAVRIVNLHHFLEQEKGDHRMSDQLYRSGTSIGANVAEAQCAISKNDFISKIYISLKECNETLYWLQLLGKTGFLDKRQFESIYADCEELKRLLVSITKTSRANNNS